MHLFNHGWEAETLIEQWRKYYNTQRPHSSLGYKTPSMRGLTKTINPQSTTLNVA